MGSLRAELDFTSVDLIMSNGLHEYLDDLQVKMNAIGDNLLLDFFASRPQSQSQSQSSSALGDQLMGIRVALHHKTIYEYDRLVTLSPQIVRLRPAPHSRTQVSSYSLRVEPEEHFINWQQDPQGNFLARLVFPNQTRRFSLEVDLVAEMAVINPFDFFLEPYAEKFPFRYEAWEQRELGSFLEGSARWSTPESISVID